MTDNQITAARLEEAQREAFQFCDESKQFYVDYCRVQGIGDVSPCVTAGTTDAIFIGQRIGATQIVGDQDIGPYLRFNFDGSVVDGIWGPGDSWDAGATVRDATNKKDD